MARPMVFRPAGDSESDEDDYLMDINRDDESKACNKFGRTSESVNANHNEDQDQGFEPPPSQSFGIPENYQPKFTFGGPPGVNTFGEPSISSAASNGPSKRNQQKKKYLHSKPVEGGNKKILLEDVRSAVIQGNLQELQNYINQGISVHEVLRTGWTVLMYAANYANVDAVSFLLENGANPNFEKDHYSVLMSACSSTSSDEKAVLSCVKLLLGKDADVNKFDRYHMTPLLYAARNNKPTVIKILLENGANKEKQDSRGYTALIWAACKGQAQAVHVLLEAGVDANRECTSGYTAKDHAEQADHHKIARVLETYTSSPNSQGALSELSSVVAQQTKESNDIPLGTIVTSTHYGELELFLIGIDLADLIPKFQEQKVTFQSFLRYTDEDLKQMGISQIGVRKKLLDTVKETHKRDWMTSSVPSVLYNNYLSCRESTHITANISNHASYMASTAGYIGDQIKINPAVLHDAKNKESVKDLANKTDEAMAKVRVLYSELAVLRKILTKEMNLGDFQAPDIILTPKRHTKKTSKLLGRRFLAVFSLSALGLVAVWKKDFITASLADLWSRSPEI